MDEIAIRAEKVSKVFKLPHERQSSIKGALINFRKRRKGYEMQQALKEVSFEVKKGEFFGIVGRNGSGKSTLLKILAGIYSPSGGTVEVNGKVTPFIELGVGFNPELTGRENVFLNGALLGFSRKEMRKMYNGIVEFAELERFMDQKLKNYSSGMQVRLAFSIAIRVKSAILILDEVLAVGDEAFQQKCIDVFEKYKAQKQTIVLVTHDMEIVRRFCSRAMLINEGRMIEIGEPREVAREYSKFNEEKIEQELHKTNKKESEKSQLNIEIVRGPSRRANSYVTGENLQVKISWPKSLKGVKNVGVGIVKQSGEFIFGANTFGESINLANKHEIVHDIELSLGPGKYSIMAGLFGDHESETIEFRPDGPQFLVRAKEADLNQGLVRMKYDWKS